MPIPETSHYAHLLLPAAQWSEKAGAMTNSERRVTFCPALPPSASAKAVRTGTCSQNVGRRLGYTEQFRFDSAAEVYAEFTRLTQGRLCDVSGLSHDSASGSMGSSAMALSQLGNKAQPQRSKRLYTDHQIRNTQRPGPFQHRPALRSGGTPLRDLPAGAHSGSLSGSVAHDDAHRESGAAYETAP